MQVFYGTHTFEILALILMADYDKLADRFVGRMPENAEAELFHDGFHDKDKFDRPACAVSHAEAVELIKARLQVCWWGPRASHKNAALLSKEAGTKFALAHEWDEGGSLGWDAAPAPAGAPTDSAAPVERKKER